MILCLIASAGVKWLKQRNVPVLTLKENFKYEKLFVSKLNMGGKNTLPLLADIYQI